MRVIAGSDKGRLLKAVPGQGTRPTGDKVKEAIFHRMGPFFDGGKGLDLFAGSGSLGIEAVSRGMDQMIFVDQSQKALKTLYQNIRMLGMETNCRVYRNQALRALETMSKKEERFALILLDPPYDNTTYQEMIDNISKNELLEAGGYLYLEHLPESAFKVPSDFENLFEKQYNKTTAATILLKN